MNRDQLFSRTRSLLDPALTASKTFAFIGLGSGGARCAEEAARLGVGQIILVDRPGERLEEHNLIRHPLGYSSLGRLKVEAMRDRLLDIHPACAVEIVKADVNVDAQLLAQVVGAADQVYLCTDTEQSRHAVNLAAVRFGVTMIFAGVFDGGCGGEVGRVVPGGACYACVAAFLQRSTRAFEPEQISFDYTGTQPQSPPSTAALNLDIAQIALIQARVGLLTLLGQTDSTADFSGNYVLFGNRPVAGLFTRMLESEIWSIPKNPNCLVCRSLELGANRADQLAGELLAVATPTAL